MWGLVARARAVLLFVATLYLCATPSSAAELVVNGSIEAGSGFTANGWVQSSTSAPFYAVRGSAADVGVVFCCNQTGFGYTIPITGTYSLLLTQTGGSTGYAYQTVTIPSGATGILTLNYRAFVQGTVPTADFVQLDIVAPGSEANPASSLQNLLTVTNTTGTQSGAPPVSGSINVSINAYAGQTISIRAYAAALTYPANLAIDDVSLQVSVTPPTITNTSPLPDGIVGSVYSQTFTAIDGSGGNVFTLDSGTLPPGLALAGDGTLSGTPTTAGLYNFVVRVTDSFGGTTTKPFALTVLTPANLVVTPSDGFASSGFEGGPFSPAQKIYTLSNSGQVALSYTASDNQPWLDTSPTSGTIAPGGSTTVTLSLNAAANALATGPHSGTLTLTNTTNGNGSVAIPASLTVIPGGQVILRVVTAEGDGTFAFTSSTPGLNANVATSGGIGQTAAVTLPPGNHFAVVALPAGFGLSSIACSDADSSGNVAGKQANIALASGETVTCTFNAVNARKKTLEVMERFLGNRAALLLSNGPDTTRWIDRLVVAGADEQAGLPVGAGFDALPFAPRVSGAGGFSARIAPAPASSASAAGKPLADRIWNSELGVRDLNWLDSEGGANRREASPLDRLSFAVNLSQIVAERPAGGLAAGEGLNDARSSRVDVWAEGHYIDFTDDRDLTDSRGHFGVVYLGADYLVRPWLLVGAMAQYDTMKQESIADSFRVEGSGWMAGPYVAMRLSRHAFFEGRVAWGSTTNDISPFLTYTDTFDTDRWLASATLSGRWNVRQWRFSPGLSVSYLEETTEAYIDSLSVAIPSVTTTLGQFKLEPEVSYVHAFASGTVIEPHGALSAIWTFDGSDVARSFGGTVSGPEELRGRVDLGVQAYFANGIVVDIAGSHDGLGSGDFSATGGKVTVRVPLN